MDAPCSPLLKQLGRIVQVAFVPRDFDAELKYWTEVIGAGPFYELSHIPLQNTFYRGKPGSADISAALGYWGDVQIELLRQHDDSPSIYREWLDQGRDGVQHLGIVVEDFDSAHALLVAAGGMALQETEIPDAVRAAYFKLPGEEPLIEILAVQPHFLELWDFMRRSAVDWDGSSHPLRPVPEETEWRAGQ